MNEVLPTIQINKRKIGPGQPVFIVAEISGNHNQSYRRALKIINAAAWAGADAVKVQTFSPDKITIDSNKKWFKVKVNKVWKGNTLYSLYQKTQTPWEWQPKLKSYAEKKGLIFFSSPFDTTAVDFLEDMNVLLYKVASFETGDLELLKKIGQTKKPVILSRGLTTVKELKLAIKTLQAAGTQEVAVLHCVSSYPATPDQMNLTTIPDIARRFNVIAGLSDHTLGTTMAIASVALGASIIEKHYTLRRDEGGMDAAFSLEPPELKQLVKSVREVQVALGKPTYNIGKKETVNLVFRRSLFAVQNIKKDEKFTHKNVLSIRPGNGLPPKYLNTILGKTASRNIEKGTPLKWSLVNLDSN